MNNIKDDSMDFDQGPNRQRPQEGQTAGFQQPGQYLDSQPESNMSVDADQISIQLSEGEESARRNSGAQPQNLPGSNQEQEDSSFQDCDLDEVNNNYNSAQVNRQVHASSLRQGASGTDVPAATTKDKNLPEPGIASPEPRGLKSKAYHQHNESDAKLLNKTDMDAIDPDQLVNRGSVSTAPYSRDSRKGSDADNNRRLPQEESKDGRLLIQDDQNKPMSVHDLNALRQSEPFFLSKVQGQQPQGVEMQERFATVKVNSSQITGMQEQNLNASNKSKQENDQLAQSQAKGGDHLQKQKDADGFPMVDPAIFELPDNVELYDEQTAEIVKNPICRRFFTTFRIIGSLCMVASIIADYSYAIKQTFSSKTLYVAYLAILILRCVIPFFVAIKNTSQRVRNKHLNRLDELPVDDQDETYQRNQKSHTKLGYLLYGVLPFTYFTGTYRLLNFKNFPSEIGTGLVMDFFCNALPLLFIQAINNATLSQQDSEFTGNPFELSDLQAFAILSKFAVLGDLILEFVMFVYELVKLHNLEKQAINVLVRYTEAERRRMFAKRYACRTCTWLVVIAIGFLLVQLSVSQVGCREDQAVEWRQVCQNCQLEFCDSCAVKGKDSCDQCMPGYYFNNKSGFCEDATCRTKHCIDCSDSGIYGCDRCDDTFILNKLLGVCMSDRCLINQCETCEVSGPNSCDSCIEGFKFNRETGLCQDTVCKKELCEDCSLNIYSCERCREGYYFDLEEEQCLDLSCKIKQCDKCVANPKVCEQCAKNYWLDVNKNECVDATCLTDKCAECNIGGPTKCDVCEVGYFLKNGKCVDCDPFPESVHCKSCSSESQCLDCAIGYRLENGKCKACEAETCAVCNAISGRCDKCKSGMYIDSSGTCKPCRAPCKECTALDTCTQCVESIHSLVSPPDGKCLCDAFRGWYPKSDREPWQCVCQKTFLTEEGICAECGEEMPGCSDCARKGDLSMDSTFGIRAIPNPAMPDSVPGVYQCNRCAPNSQFFDYQKNACSECSTRLPGCIDCNGDPSRCLRCKDKHFLKGDGQCLNCAAGDKDCNRCNDKGCLACNSGYFIFPGTSFCTINPFAGLF